MRPRLDKPYSELVERDKEDNRAAGRRIVSVLTLLGLGLEREGDAAPQSMPQEELSAMIERNIERLAEAEHDGWMEHLRHNGWRYAEARDNTKKLHPSMLPYAELTEQDKEKDRNNVRHYPEFAARAGYRIVRLK